MMRYVKRFLHAAFRPRFRVLSVYVIIALFAPLLATHDPLLLYSGGEVQFPAFNTSPYVQLHPGEAPVLKSTVDWRLAIVDYRMLAPVCYSTQECDAANTNFASPFENQYWCDANGNKLKLPLRYRHWLGTTRSGQDVLSNLLHGCRTALFIGCCSMLFAAFIAMLSGLTAGYYGDNRLRVNSIGILVILMATVLSYFHTHQLLEGILFKGWMRAGTAVLFFIMLLAFWTLVLYRMSKRLRFAGLDRAVSVPVDRLFLLVTTTFTALPRLVLVISLAALFPGDVASLIIIIGLTSWAEPARLIRTEMMRIRNLPFMEQSQAAGNTPWRTLVRHAVPNLSSIIRTVFLTGIAGAILTEAGLSFIGIGVPFGTPSWGFLIVEAKRNMQAWWLVVPPGIALLLLLRSLMNAGRSAEPQA